MRDRGRRKGGREKFEWKRDGKGENSIGTEWSLLFMAKQFPFHPRETEDVDDGCS